MFGLLTWWYTTGWQILMRHMGERIADVLRFFSVGQLAASLFAPFRQISAGSVRGSLDVKFRAWLDQLFSRVIGAVVRLMLIVAGLGTAMLLSLLAVLLIILWPVLPMLPLIGLVLAGVLAL